jgi:hypothetical protein
VADLGDTLRFSSDLTDGSGVLVNASSVSLTVTLPDGTTVSPPVTNPPSVTGKYVYDYVTTALSPAGRYTGQWLFTMAGGATTSYVELCDVGSSLVSVDEAVAHLRAAGIITSEADLEQLQWLTLVASEAVELDLGRVFLPRTFVEIHDGGGAIVLHQSPVLSITSVMESGSVLTEYLPNLAAGILYRGTAYAPRAFLSGFQNVVVTYRAGSLNPPRVVRQVALSLVQSMWQSSQQAPHPALTEFNDQDVFAAVSALAPVEQRAYESLRAAAIA